MGNKNSLSDPEFVLAARIISKQADRIEELEERLRPKLGKGPNRRKGFHHIHSNSFTCGMAYFGKDHWWPCKKLVNHEGDCGYEDNSAF